MWLRRFIERVIERGDEVGSQARRVEELIYRRSVYDSASEFLAAILALLPASQPLADATLARLSRALCGNDGQLSEDLAGEQPAYLDFWQELHRRFPANPYLVACHAELLRISGQLDQAVAEFLQAFSLDPQLVFEFGDDVGSLIEAAGGRAWLSYRLCSLRAELADPGDDAGDSIREQYSELLEEYEGDQPALQEIREVGRLIEKLTSEEKLPRAFVRRTRSRSRKG